MNSVSPSDQLVATTKPTPQVTPECQKTFYSTQVSVFHLIIAIVAFYLVFKCNTFSEGPGVFVGSFFMACCCPYLYIPYILARYWSKDGICMK
jgi:hypothetical protein